MSISKQLLLAGLAVGAIGYAAPSSAVLTHHWTFDNADIVGTNGAGDVVGSADATAPGTNGGTGITTGLEGVFGEAYAFVPTATNAANANSGVVTEEGMLTVAAGNVPVGAAARTFSLWFNQSLDVNQDKLFGYGEINLDFDGTTGEAFDITLEGGGVRLRNFNGNFTYGTGLEFFADDGAGNAGANAGWNHLAVRVNDSAATYADIDFFLNGVMLAPQDAADADFADDLTTMVDNIDGFGIANTSTGQGGSTNGNGFNGLLDEFRIYDNALTNQEILDLSVVPVAAGDTDGDGDIDDSDLGTSFANYTGPVGAAGGKTAAEGDTDGDGDVDDSDLGTSFAGYTGPLGPASVPEPTSLALIGLGGLLIARRRRA